MLHDFQFNHIVRCSSMADLHFQLRNHSRKVCVSVISKSCREYIWALKDGAFVSTWCTWCLLIQDEELLEESWITIWSRVSNAFCYTNVTCIKDMTVNNRLLPVLQCRPSEDLTRRSPNTYCCSARFPSSVWLKCAASRWIRKIKKKMIFFFQE